MKKIEEGYHKRQKPIEIVMLRSGAAFSKVPRRILGKLLILGATDTQV